MVATVPPPSATVVSPMIPSPPDTRASLIGRLRDAADVAAWDEFVAIYGPLVHRLAMRQGLQSADAEDVVQQVFAAVSQSVYQWLERPQQNRFRAWLLTIARNIAIKTLTRRPHGGVGLGGDPVCMNWRHLRKICRATLTLSIGAKFIAGPPSKFKTRCHRALGTHFN